MGEQRHLQLALDGFIEKLWGGDIKKDDFFLISALYIYILGIDN